MSKLLVQLLMIRLSQGSLYQYRCVVAGTPSNHDARVIIRYGGRGGGGGGWSYCLAIFIYFTGKLKLKALIFSPRDRLEIFISIFIFYSLTTSFVDKIFISTMPCAVAIYLFHPFVPQKYLFKKKIIEKMPKIVLITIKIKSWKIHLSVVLTQEFKMASKIPSPHTLFSFRHH